MAEKKVLVLNPTTGELQQQKSGDTVFGLAPNETAAKAADLQLEITARANGDLAEVTARTSAINAEATLRANADTTLQANIAAEATARATEDTSIRSLITNLGDGYATDAELALEATARIGGDNAEITARTNADTTLQANIAAEATARIAADNAEATARALEDASLRALVGGGSGALDAEITARIAADNAEITARTSADNAEITARTNADTTLQANIAAEATARSLADTTLQANIAAEATARGLADTTLQANIAAEATARGLADTTLQANIDLKVAKAGDTMTGNLVFAADQYITIPTPTGGFSADTQAVNKIYVDSKTAGLTWEQPVQLSNLLGSATAAPASPNLRDAYIIDTGGASGDWSGFAAGDVVQFQEGFPTNVWVKIRTLQVGDRYGVSFTSTVDGVGIFDGEDNGIATITNATPGSLAATFWDAVDAHAVFVENPLAASFGRSYVWNSDDSAWYVFSGPSATGAGIGLMYTGNTLNVNLGAGIQQLPTDEVGIDVYAGGGIQLVDPTTGLASTLTDSQVGIKLDGTSLSVASAGLKIADGTFTTLQSNVTTAVAAEATLRANADTTLQANINAEATARANADNAEITARTNADTTLQANIDAEATLRANGDLAEVTARSLADTTLQANINAEATARATEDTSIRALITGLGDGFATDAELAAEATLRANADTTLQTNIGNEATARGLADTTLQANIDAEATLRANGDLAEITARTSAINAEATLRANADTTLQANIDAEATARANADNAEITARTNADTTLQANIDAEVTARKNDVDSEESARILAINAEATARALEDASLRALVGGGSGALDAEITARTNADLTLQANINTEITARTGADTTLQNNINAEATARDLADTTLQTNIGNEATARGLADTTLQANIDLKVAKAGDTMTGNLAFGGTHTVTGLISPTDGTDAANKNYVDSLVGGLSWKAAVDSVGATNPATAAIGERFLNTTDGKIYTATAVNTWGTGVAAADGDSVFNRVDEMGYVYSGSAWTQFTGAGQITAGVGLLKTGNSLDINLGAGIAQLPSDEVGIDLYSSTGALILTTDGSTTSSDTASKLYLKLEANKGLEQTVAGLAIDLDETVAGASGLVLGAGGIKIGAAKVTNAMLQYSSITMDSGSGSDIVDLGSTFAIMGNNTQGIVTSINNLTSTLTITASDATAAQKGVATFASADFTVTSGDVALKTQSSVTPGTYNSFTVNSKGIITAASAAIVENDKNTLDVTTTGAAVGDAVYISGAGASTKAIATAAGTSKVAGFVSEAGKIVTSGTVTVTGASFTPGARYFLSGDTAGAITATPPTTGFIAPVGIAASATQIIVQIGTIIEL